MARSRYTRASMVIHYVHDMNRALNFYKDVFEVHSITESPGWSVLDFSPITLALHILDRNEAAEHPLPHAGLNFEVDSIEFLQVRIEANGGALKEIIEPRDGVPVRVASFQDSEGNGFELRQWPET